MKIFSTSLCLLVLLSLNVFFCPIIRAGKEFGVFILFESQDE